MRRLALAAALAAVGCGEPASPRPPPAAGGTRLNIVLITIDTLRADHMGCYGYPRRTTPRLDRLAAQSTVFERAYTYWPKTRGSFVALFTGRHDSQSGYSRLRPLLAAFNPTLAGVLKSAGYATAAFLDNGNLAAANGYAQGFDEYVETWQDVRLKGEMDRARAITDGALRFLGATDGRRPFLLWLHYVNPHAPYTPPPPYDRAFLDARAERGPRLPVVGGFHGGIPKRWAVPGRDRLGYYVAQYDGEVAAVDQEVGRVLDGIRASDLWDRTVIAVTADHGESLGEHGYYFDHGEDLFDPTLRVPLLVRVPAEKGGARVSALASTLDLMPTLLDAAKVSFPPGLDGRSLLPALRGRDPGRERVFARSDRDLTATGDGRFKLVAEPGPQVPRLSLYDLVADPAETRDVSREQPEELRRQKRELDVFLERVDREWARTRQLLGDATSPPAVTPEACENLRALGYVQQCVP